MMRQGGYFRNEADAEAALQRILDATVEAGGVLADNFPQRGISLWCAFDEHPFSSKRDAVWGGIEFTMCWFDTMQQLSSRARADYERRLKRIIGAAQVIQRELSAPELSRHWGPKAVDQAKDLEHAAESAIRWRHAYWEHLNKSPVFTPLLTKSIVPLVGTLVQPYMRRSIADALNEFEKLPRP
jgi:hypothetical protein